MMGIFRDIVTMCWFGLPTIAFKMVSYQEGTIFIGLEAKLVDIFVGRAEHSLK